MALFEHQFGCPSYQPDVGSVAVTTQGSKTPRRAGAGSGILIAPSNRLDRARGKIHPAARPVRHDWGITWERPRRRDCLEFDSAVTDRRYSLVGHISAS